MRLSVVVPAHDAQGTVAAAIRSALGQTRPPDEVVVVDDGSSDATPTVVRALGDAVRLVVQAQAGPSAARNAGVAASSGDWIAFLDADDEWHPEKLEHQVSLVRDDVALVATDWARDAVTAPAPKPVATTLLTTGEILLLNRFQTSTVLLRREAFDAAGGFESSLDGVEDWDMWLRASRQGKVVKLDWPFVRYTDVAAGYSKALERVYRTGRTMLQRELGEPPSRSGRAVMAWHHLRFALAYLLAGDRAAARACVADLRAAGLVGAAPVATVRYVLPFLAGRAKRRLRRALPPS
ncbi:MAG TPA: glycosyltransferase family A protein [Acidimicrobiales bacterium]|nr:glycosyltransferase family A protein [Acidimicrobiales bacterium]